MAVIPRLSFPVHWRLAAAGLIIRFWVPICVSLPGVIVIGAGQPACFVFGYQFRWLRVAGRITIDDVANPPSEWLGLGKSGVVSLAAPGRGAYNCSANSARSRARGVQL
jgi:hypothetical protein